MTRFCMLAALLALLALLLPATAGAQTAPNLTNGSLTTDPFVANGPWAKVPSASTAVTWQNALANGITAQGGTGWVQFQARPAIADPGAPPASASVTAVTTHLTGSSATTQTNSSSSGNLNLLVGDNVSVSVSASRSASTSNGNMLVRGRLYRGPTLVAIRTISVTDSSTLPASVSFGYTVNTAGSYSVQVFTQTRYRVADDRPDLLMTGRASYSITRSDRGQAAITATIKSTDLTVEAGSRIGFEMYGHVPVNGVLAVTITMADGTLLRASQATARAGWQPVFVPLSDVRTGGTANINVTFTATAGAGYTSGIYAGMDTVALFYIASATADTSPPPRPAASPPAAAPRASPCRGPRLPAMWTATPPSARSCGSLAASPAGPTPCPSATPGSRRR